MQTAYGSIIAAAIIVLIIAPLYGKILRFFPTVVTGTVVTMIGLSLVNVGVTSIGGVQVLKILVALKIFY